MPTSSQEALTETLDPKNGKPTLLTEMEFVRIVDTLIFHEEDEIIEHFIDVACDMLMKKITN